MKKRLSMLFALMAIVVVCLVSFVACGKSDVIAAPTNVTYDRPTAVLKWNTVENATKYSVSFNGDEPTMVTANSIPYTSDKAFSVSVKAVMDIIGGKSISSDATTVNFTPLSTIETLVVSETGEVSWDPVENATAYKVQVKSTNAKIAEYDVEETKISNISEVGNVTISVRPIVSGNNSYFSKFSSPKTITLLAPVHPKSITYDDKVGLLRWSGVSGASAYELKINGTVVSSTLTSTSYSYQANSTTFTAGVKPLGDKKVTFDAKSAEEKTFKWLEMARNVRVVDGIVVWDEVAGADSYVVKLSTATAEVVVNQHSYDGLAEGVPTGVQIKPQNSAGNTDYVQWFSGYTTELTIQLLKAPVLKWNNNMQLDGDEKRNVFWDGVAGAEGYNVKLISPSNASGEISTLSAETAPSFPASFNAVGTYYVSVQATASGTDNNTHSSKYSEPIKVIRLAAPKLSANQAITSDPKSLAKGFVVHFDSVSNAMGYELSRDGLNDVQKSATTEFRVTNVVEESVLNEQILDYGISSKGSGTMTRVGNENIVVLSSLSAQATKFSITVLATPLNHQIDGFIYKYDQVNKANGYVIDVGGTAYEEGTLSYNLSSVLKSGQTYNAVRVCAKGNGSNVLASNFTPGIKVVRLEKPSEIKIETADSSEGVLNFKGSAHAESYKIAFNNEVMPATIGLKENISQYITTQGTAVYLVSHKNNYENEDSGTRVYYMDSENSETVMFKKLSAPTFGNVKFTNTELLWNAPENANTSVKYMVYNPVNNNSYSTAFSGTSFNITSKDIFPGGKEYSFQVKAIGDGVTTINSDKSAVVKIFRLATPTVNKVNGKYTWESVSQAQGYRVLVDGKDVVKQGETWAESTYDPKAAFTALKTYKVEFYAIGDNGVKTIDSFPLEIQQTTTQLDVPTFELAYSLESYDPNGEIKVTVKNKSPFATQYAFVVDDAEGRQAADLLEYSTKPRAAGAIKVKVYAVGGSFDNSGNYCLNSVTTNIQTIYLLTTPNEDSINVVDGAKKTLKWGTVDNMVEYEVEWTCGDGTKYTKKTTETSLEIDKSQFFGNVIVRIRALGDGKTSITGAWVETEKFKNQ